MAAALSLGSARLSLCCGDIAQGHPSLAAESEDPLQVLPATGSLGGSDYVVAST